MNKRKLFFLRDVLFYTFTSFGGPQAHIAILLRDFVKKRNYVSEPELLELNALCSLLPGPSSTQTLVAIAYKVGGLRIAIITFFIWMLPSATIMFLLAVFFRQINPAISESNVVAFLGPIALGFVAFAAFILSKKILTNKIAITFAVIACVATVIFRNAFVFPVLIILGGIISSLLNTNKEEREIGEKLVINVNLKKVAYFFGVLIVFALLGALVNRTSPFSLPIRLFENFYRNGSIIFGGGQVLIPFMYTEFVEIKKYLTAQEFLSGYAFQQMLPGPIFSFTSFLGGMAMNSSNIYGQALGSFAAVMGVNLPGLILILFILPFWNNLKKITRIKNSLSGVNAISVGFIIAAFILLLMPIGISFTSVTLMLVTFGILLFTKIPTPLIILAGIILGVIF